MALQRWGVWLSPVLGALFLAWKPATSGPTICPFALATGHACPLCGGTRAAAALIDGDIGAAWQLHPIIFVMAPMAIAGWISWLGVIRGWWSPPSVRTVNVIGLGLGLGLVAIWLVRLATGTLPPV